MEIRSIHTIETAENVHIKVELAGLAARVFAFGIDVVIMGMLTAVVIGGFALWGYAQGNEQISKTGIPIGTFVVFFGYHLFQEWLWNGRTVGKAILNIRVVRNNGQAIGFWESLGRNLLRIVDVYASGIGLLCMMFNKGEKRFGDFVGGTIVINDARILKPAYTALSEQQDESAEDAQYASVRLTAEEAELLKTYKARRGTLLKDAHQQLGQSLREHFSERLRQPVLSDEELDTALEAYQQSLRQS